MCDWKGPFNRIVLAGLFVLHFTSTSVGCKPFIEECIILFMTSNKGLLQALEPGASKLFFSVPSLLFPSNQKRKNSMLGQALFSSFLFKSRLVLITTHFHLGLWHIKCQCVWKPACEYTHTDGTRTDTFIYWGGKNIAQVVICWGIKSRLLLRMNWWSRNMRGRKWKTTSNLFLHLEPDHHTPLFLFRLIEIEEMGRGKAVQFSAI